jgi:phage shock protein PspC (stress-responsive transcriptional regulator)
MSDSEELSKLAALHQSGALSDDEFARAKARVLNHTAPLSASRTEAPAMDAINALRRSRDDRWIGGVCGGIARSTGMASWIWRLMFTLLTLFAGSGVLLYALLWIFVPEE